MNCDDPPNLAWTQQDLYIPQPTTPIPPRRYIYLKLGTFLTEHEILLNYYFIKNNNQNFKIHY